MDFIKLFRMKKILFVLVVVICELLPFWGGGQEVKKSEDGARVTVLKKGDLCPEFVFKDMQGEEVTLKQFRGKYVVIDVWASWCYPCKREFPNLKRLEEKYKGKNIVFVSISCDQSERRWQNELGFLRDKLIRQWWAEDGDFMKAFQIVAIPRLILLDKKGQVIDFSLPQPSDAKFEKILNKLKGL
jgi:thioredoxin